MTFPDARSEKVDYQEHWSQNAAHFDKQGCYDWMAQQLGAIHPKKILDIGCGTGEGLAALKRAFSSTIVAIDENEQCLRHSAQKLGSSGESVSLCTRFEYPQQRDGTHVIGASTLPITVSDDLMLVQGDILLDDAAMNDFLSSQAPFDAVTLWLVGAYNCRKSCATIAHLRISSPAEYRLRVQNRAYELAARLLRSGGLFQVVDRGEPLVTKTLQDDHISGHREQSSVTDLQVFRLDSRPYTEHTVGKGVQMVTSPGTSGRIPNLGSLCLHSVLSKKP